MPARPVHTLACCLPCLLQRSLMVLQDDSLQGLRSGSDAEEPEGDAAGSAAVGAASTTPLPSEGELALHTRLMLCSPRSTRLVHACLQIFQMVHSSGPPQNRLFPNHSLKPADECRVWGFSSEPADCSRGNSYPWCAPALCRYWTLAGP